MQTFKNWVQSTQTEDMYEFNPNSSQHLTQLFFAPYKRNKKIKKRTKKADEDLDSDEEFFK